MTNNNTANVAAGKPKVNGAIFVAPVGATLPTDASTVLDAAFKNLGFISDDGVTLGTSRSVESKKGWGGVTIATLQKEVEDTAKFTLVEVLNPEVLKVVCGTDNVTTDTNGIKAVTKADELGAHAWVIDTIQNGRAVRYVYPVAPPRGVRGLKYGANSTRSGREGRTPSWDACRLKERYH